MPAQPVRRAVPSSTQEGCRHRPRPQPVGRQRLPALDQLSVLAHQRSKLPPQRNRFRRVAATLQGILVPGWRSAPRRPAVHPFPEPVAICRAFASGCALRIVGASATVPLVVAGAWAAVASPDSLTTSPTLTCAGALPRWRLSVVIRPQNERPAFAAMFP